MAENFDLIFGQNASQQYAWNDADYQNGWGTIGNIPPTAAQFDALQRRSDTKMKELNDELTPLVNADTADSRQPSTAYSVDDIKYSPLLPTGWFLTCTVAGTTSASEIVLPTPIAENDTVTDGTVTWEIHKIGTGSGGDGFAVGDIKAIAYNGTIQDGWLECDGRAVSRTMFPDLFDKIGTTYGAGDGSTTFNVPDYNAAERFCQGSTVAGGVKQAGLPNIKGTLSMVASSPTSSGAFSHSTVSGSAFGVGDAGGRLNYALNASRSSAIYGNSTTVQPKALTARYIIKAYDGVTPTPAEADISEMLTELTGKADRALGNLSADGENHFLEQDFTIIYPNGGSEASPANVTKNTRYVETNPFPGYYVKCEAEIKINDDWGWPGWYTDESAGTNYSCFASAKQLNDNNIIVQTGQYSLGHIAARSGNPFNASTDVATAPCRVKVWKIGKIPD